MSGISSFLGSIGQLLGTPTNDNAAAGRVGEYQESVIVIGSAVSLSNATAANLTSLSLTAGDWDVDMIAIFTGTTAAASLLVALNTTSATISFTPGNFGSKILSGAGTLPTCEVGKRFSLASTTTIYAVMQASFGAGTCSGYGIMRARRVR